MLKVVCSKNKSQIVYSFDAKEYRKTYVVLWKPKFRKQERHYIYGATWHLSHVAASGFAKRKGQTPFWNFLTMKYCYLNVSKLSFWNSFSVPKLFILRIYFSAHRYAYDNDFTLSMLVFMLCLRLHKIFVLSGEKGDPATAVMDGNNSPLQIRVYRPEKWSRCFLLIL